MHSDVASSLRWRQQARLPKMITFKIVSLGGERNWPTPSLNDFKLFLLLDQRLVALGC